MTGEERVSALEDEVAVLRARCQMLVEERDRLRGLARALGTLAGTFELIPRTAADLTEERAAAIRTRAAL